MAKAKIWRLRQSLGDWLSCFVSGCVQKFLRAVCAFFSPVPFSDCVNEVREQERAPRAPLKERAGHESGYENMAHGQLLCIYAAFVYCCVRAFSDMCSCVGEAGMRAQHTFGNQAGGRDTIGRYWKCLSNEEATNWR